MSDFRIDIRTDLVYGDVSLKTGSTSVNDNNVDIFNIGAGLSLTFTNDAIGAMNAARPSTRRGPTLSQCSRCGTEQKTGDVVLHEGSGLELSKGQPTTWSTPT